MASFFQPRRWPGKGGMEQIEGQWPDRRAAACGPLKQRLESLPFKVRCGQVTQISLPIPNRCGQTIRAHALDTSVPCGRRIVSDPPKNHGSESSAVLSQALAECLADLYTVIDV